MEHHMTVYPCRRVAGTLQVPGDKSISHRVAMLAALAEGTSHIRGLLRGDDCLRTVSAMATLGAPSAFEGDALVVTGAGGRWRQPAHALDMGNSGTSMRLIAGLVAGRPLVVEMTGDASLCGRPMGRIREPLERMGAGVDLLGAGGRPPLRVRGARLHGMDYRLPVASAQVKSCVLLAALFAEGRTRVWEPAPTRDHTERLFQAVGIPLARGEEEGLAVDGYGPEGPRLAGRAWRVPGDFSSAAFWLVAGAASLEGDVTVRDVGLNPRRTALLDILRRMGAEPLARPSEAEGETGEPCGDLRVVGGALTGTEVGGREIPNAIDELPLVAVAGALAEGRTVIRDARELRVKESDRIACMAGNLRQLGVTVDEHEDGMTIVGGARIRGRRRVPCYGDHRIAMAMAVLALRADGPVTIEAVDCVGTSYPDFWDHLRGLGARVEAEA